jgi:GntR family transcriptional regulator, transcriptional repressor for pyruvate dehydrogenase complex
LAKTYLMSLALAAEVLHALLVDAPADDLGSAAASEAVASITETVVQRLEDLVLGELEPGAELPSEAELAARFEVSRLTVREAARSLQARGLVEIRQGRRTVVAHPNARPIGGYFSAAVRRDPRQLLDLVEVRKALEVHIASLAAAQASRTDVAAMELALAAMREAADDPMALHESDIGFHASLATAAGNQMLRFLIEAMEEPLWASRMRSLRGHLARGGTVEDVIEQHARILERIKARDSKGAAAAMLAHLEQTARDLRAAFTLTGLDAGGDGAR